MAPSAFAQLVTGAVLLAGAVVGVLVGTAQAETIRSRLLRTVLIALVGAVGVAAAALGAVTVFEAHAVTQERDAHRHLVVDARSRDADSDDTDDTSEP